MGVVLMADPIPGLDKIPGLGKVKNKWVLGGVFVAAAVGIVVFVRARKAASAAAAQATTAAPASDTGQVTDPAGNVCTALDPDSGYCPGTAEDQSYYSEQESTLGDEGDAGTGGVSGTGTSGYDAAGYPVGSAADLAWEASQAGGTGTGTGSTGSPATNSDWVTEAVGELPGDAGTIQTALSSVLGGLTVTTAQKNLFEEAVGLLGRPPGGYPTPIKTSDTSSQPGSTAGQATVPSVVGQTAGAAHNAIVAAKLKPVADAGQKDTAKVTSTNPKGGTKVAQGSSVVITATNPPAPKVTKK